MLNSKYKIALIGATGNVGRIIAEQLLNKKIANQENLYLFASNKSAGQKLNICDQTFTIKKPNLENLRDCNLCIFATNSDISHKYISQLLNYDTYIIDSSSYYRLDPNVPLIIPNVNNHLITLKHKLFAHANCITSPIAMILGPLHKALGVKYTAISTYQSTSGAGFKAMQECVTNTTHHLNNNHFHTKEFDRSIAFNLIPKIGTIRKDGKTSEEYKIIEELKKVIDTNLKLSVTSVRVPVIVGHSVALTIQLENKFSLQEIIDIFQQTTNIIVSYDYHTPVEVVGKDQVFVGRIRYDEALPNGLQLWSCSDNLRVGAATDAVSIAIAILQKISPLINKN